MIRNVFPLLLLLFASIVVFPAHAAQNKWSAIGPYGGYAYEFTYLPGTRIVFAAVDETYGDAFRSTDSGVSWEMMNVPNDAAMKIRVSGNVALCASEGWISKSNNGGVTWSFVSRPPIYGEYDIQMHTQNPEIVYYSAINFPDGYFYKSTNGGRTWARKTSGLSGTPPLGAIAVSRQNGNLLYVLAQKGMYRSTDAGETWKYSHKKEWVYGTPHLKIDPNNGNTLYEFAYWALGGGAEELFKTTDAGKTWRQLFPAANDIAIDPRNSAHLFATGDDAVQESFDGGSTWRALLGPFPKQPFFSFVDVSPSDPNTILLSQFIKGVLRSTNQGRTWAISNRGFQGVDTHDFLPHPNGSLLAPVTIYLDRLLFRGSPTGQNWKIVPESEDMASIIMHPRNHNILAGIQGSYVAISSDAGATWSARNTGNRRPVAISFDPVDPNTIYMAPEDWNDGYTIWSRGIFKTSDQGRSWTNIWSPESYRSIRILANHPQNRTVVLAGDHTGKILKTVDSGRTWSDTAGPQCQSEISSINFSPSKPSVVYASTFRSNCSHLYKSTDAGSNWEPIDNQPGNNIGFDSIQPDERYPSVVYAWNRVRYVSTTAGKDWSLADNKGINWINAFHNDPNRSSRSFAAGWNSIFSYTRYPENGPLILQMFPNPAAAGSSVELRGRNFGTAQGQVLLGTRRLPVGKWTDQSIVVHLTADSQTAPVTVIAGSRSHSPELIVLPAKEKLHPLSGPPSGGTRVAILLKPGDPSGGIVMIGDKYAFTVAAFSLALRNDDLAGAVVILCTTPPGSGKVPVYLMNSESKIPVGTFEYK